MIHRERTPSDRFLAACLDWLQGDPAVNNLPISLLHRAMHDREFRETVYLIAAYGSAGIAALAWRSDFPKMGVAAGDALDAVDEIAATVRGEMPQLPCVMGPTLAARRFVEAWRRPGEPEPALGTAQLIYRLDRVVPHQPVDGGLELAAKAQSALAVDWFTRFAEEARQPPHDLEETARRRIRDRSLFFWVDGEPVCLVGAVGPPGQPARIGPVYTPPERRRRGYAGAAVAAASQTMLDLGHPLCCLYTDAANPTSNHIYQGVGYERVCEVAEYWFRAPLSPPVHAGSR